MRRGVALYCLMVNFNGWNGRRGSMAIGRTFEHTENRLIELFTKDGVLNYELAASYPALFMSEDRWDAAPVAYVGSIQNLRRVGNELTFTYQFDTSIDPIPNTRLHEMAAELEIADFEFSRTHWAMKDVDLFRVLLSNSPPRRQQPSVFRLHEPETVQNNLVSLMMPFDNQFDGVHQAIRQAAEQRDLECLRADNIWENPAIIQDVVSLIDRSRLVICDCSGRNPNVFYEMGIAHTLGREVVLIAQAANDIPFDVRHLRYITYHNNNEGRAKLVESLAVKLNALP